MSRSIYTPNNVTIGAKFRRHCQGDVRFAFNRTERCRNVHCRRLKVLATHNVDQQWSLRKGMPKDLARMQSMIWQEKMNPIGLEPERFLVAESVDGQLLGFCQIEAKPSEEKKEYTEVRSLVVDETARGQGIAKALVTELLKDAKGDIFVLTVGGVKGFYESMGFKEIDVNDMPLAIKLEWFAGIFVARLAINQRCLAMKRTINDS